MLGVLSWLVLAAGALWLLTAAGVPGAMSRVEVIAFLVFLPAATNALVQFFHPQDMVSLGLGLLGLAAVLRGRNLVAGVLFGLAILTKQFAFLLLLPALTVLTSKERVRTAGVAAGTLALGLLPFLLVAPHATVENFSGFSAGGAVAGETLLSLVGVTGHIASAIARDAPVLFAAGLCWWAARRVDTPPALLALALACVGSRLVFESVIFPYYLLATSVVFLLADLVARRTPSSSLTWCAAAAFFVAIHPSSRPVEAVGTLALAVAAVIVGVMRVAQS